MKEKDILMMSIEEISKLIRKKQISPVEIVEKAIQRTSMLEKDLNAYITFLPDEAIKKAKISEQDIFKNGPKSLLHGIPFSVKDLFYTKGILTTAGSKILSHFIPDYNSTVVERLNKAGAILMGKNNLDKWALSGVGGSYYGITRNPWDISRIAGGSSGGSAAAVAAGMVYMAMGTDTGGSIRNPASFCGVIGFKPTTGLLSLYGVIPLSLMFDTVGPIGRSVADIAITMDLISGYDPHDRNKNHYKSKNTNFFTKEFKDTNNLKGLTIGIPGNYFFDKVDYEIEKLIRQFVLDLKQLGATIKHITIPNIDQDIITDISTLLIYSEAVLFHKDFLKTYHNEYSPESKSRLEQGLKYPAYDYVSALWEKDKIIETWEQVFSQVDVIVIPTVSLSPFKVNSETGLTQGKEESIGKLSKILVKNTRLANLIGCPALTIPCGFTPENMPVGATIMGGIYEDLTVLKVGHVYEKYHPFVFKHF